MADIINQSDLLLVQQNTLELAIKIEVYDSEGNLLNTITSNIVEGAFTVDSTSDIRRTCSLTVTPDKNNALIANTDDYVWINKSAAVYIGLKDIRTNQYTWYKQGCYYFKDTSAAYDASSNTFNISAGDFMMRFENGHIGGSTQIIIPAYETDKETGETVKHTTIREALISVITQFANVQEYIIDDIGEPSGISQTNGNWLSYREEHPLWNTLPYDLEFSSEGTILQIISEIRDLYPNYETFFDEDGRFVCQIIPNCDSDKLVFTDAFFQNILISEDASVDYTTVYNVCEVWGDVIETDRYIDTSRYEDNTYSCAIENYEQYKSGETIAVCIPSSNNADPYFKINNLESVEICYEYSNQKIPAGILAAGKTYAFKIAKAAAGDNAVKFRAYLLGEWQPHAVAALVDGSESVETYTTSDGRSVKKYSADYFKDKYNCNTVSLCVIPNSPFTVQRLGELLDVKSGNDYNNITSDSLALERAEYENWKTTRLTDTIVLKTKIVPFADVNMKCSYRRSSMTSANTYVVKSIQHNFSEGTTTWTLYRHYPSLKTILETTGTHDTLSSYLHAVLNSYTHEELTNVKGV